MSALRTTLEIGASILLGVGTLLMLLAAVGLLRLPDLYSRMQGASKASGLGLVCFLVAGAVFMPGWENTFKLSLAAIFQFMTAPVAAHVIARAAHRAGIPHWDRSDTDALRDDAGPTPSD